MKCATSLSENPSITVATSMREPSTCAQIRGRHENRTQAAKAMRPFLDLWKYADPGFPDFEDAKERLAALAVN